MPYKRLAQVIMTIVRVDNDFSRGFAFFRRALGRPVAHAVLLSIFAASASAQDLEPIAALEPIAQDDRSTVAFVWENDRFASTDRNYTNGVRLSWLSGTRKTTGMFEAIADLLGADDDGVRRVGFAIGHSIFTPADIDTPEPLPDQHPYAGWLYGEFNAVLQQRDAVHTFALQLGIIGPGAAGEFVQNEFHSVIGVDDAQGWDNQIKNTPGVNFSFDRKFRRLASLPLGPLAADVTPNAGFAFGTVYTNAHAGLTFRFGQDLANDVGPPRVSPSLGGAGYFTPQDSFSWYFFIGAEGRAVAHNIFLDGSLFRSGDPSVDSKTLVADVQGGLVLQLGRVQAALTVVRRTREFRQQDGAQRFGAFSISGKF